MEKKGMAGGLEVGTLKKPNENHKRDYGVYEYAHGQKTTGHGPRWLLQGCSSDNNLKLFVLGCFLYLCFILQQNSKNW